MSKPGTKTVGVVPAEAGWYGLYRETPGSNAMVGYPIVAWAVYEMHGDEDWDFDYGADAVVVCFDGYVEAQPEYFWRRGEELPEEFSWFGGEEPK